MDLFSASNFEIKKQIDELKKQIEEHNYRYYVLAQPIISDYEFDKLLNKLIELEKQYPEFATPDSPTQRVGGTITKEFKTVKHRYPMLSLANTYSQQELIEFDERIKKNLGDQSYEYVCELKYDGVAVSLIYENGLFIQGLTRGDGVQGDDITANLKTIKTIPLKLKGNYPPLFEIRGEVVYPHQAFEKLNKEMEELGEQPFSNPRNTAAGTLKLQDSAEVAKRRLDCFLYFVLGDNLPFKTHWESIEAARSWGFNVPQYSQLCNTIQDVWKYIETWDEKRHHLNFDTDGIVIKINDLKQQSLLGLTAKSPRWAIAYKYKAEQAQSLLESISYQVGRTGAITPVANLKPVKLAGTIVKRASLHNADIIEKLDVRIGDTVLIEKGGEIIPKIVGVVIEKRPANLTPLQFITHCPICNTKLIRNADEAQHYCPNEYGCLPQIVGKITHFASRKAMNIEGLGEETAQLLVEKKLITTIADIYSLNVNQLKELDRWGEKSAQNLINAIQKSKEVPFERVLYAIGIRYVGETTAQKLAKHFKNIQALSNASIDELLEADEIGIKIANSIKSYFNNPYNQIIIKRLKEANLNFEILNTDKQLSDKLKGLSFVVSGVFNHFSRNSIKSTIEEHGGKVLSSVTGKTNYLVAGDKMGPEKLKKAEKLGVKIISEDEFIQMLS
jgi:DNA ligase (NAD+)